MLRVIPPKFVIMALPPWRPWIFMDVQPGFIVSPVETLGGSTGLLEEMSHGRAVRRAKMPGKFTLLGRAEASAARN